MAEDQYLQGRRAAAQARADPRPQRRRAGRVDGGRLGARQRAHAHRRRSGGRDGARARRRPAPRSPGARAEAQGAPLLHVGQAAHLARRGARGARAGAARRLPRPRAAPLLSEPRRSAGPLLGWAGLDAVGQEGIELEYERYLRGARAQLPGLRDALGRAVLIGGIGDVADVAGHDLYTTIDRYIQFRLERALEKGVTAHHAKAGIAVALDPNNGEVLAMASVPSLNPNEPDGARERGARNRAVTDPFEPGSTMKTLHHRRRARGRRHPRRRELVVRERPLSASAAPPSTTTSRSAT